MELTAQEIITLCPMKIELVSDRKECKLSELQMGNLFYEDVNFPSKSGYFISYDEPFLVLASLGFGGKFHKGFPNHFTNVPNFNVYQPHIFRQLSGKYKGMLVCFPFYEAWKKYYNTLEDFKNASDRRAFLHSYVNQNIVY